MSVREQLAYWSLGLLAFVLVLWFLSDALLPFVLAAAIAYLTDPVAGWMEHKGISRVLATILITLLVVAVVVVSLLLVIPVLIEQIREHDSRTERRLEREGIRRTAYRKRSGTMI